MNVAQGAALGTQRQRQTRVPPGTAELGRTTPRPHHAGLSQSSRWDSESSSAYPSQRFALGYIQSSRWDSDACDAVSSQRFTLGYSHTVPPGRAPGAVGRSQTCPCWSPKKGRTRAKPGCAGAHATRRGAPISGQKVVDHTCRTYNCALMCRHVRRSSTSTTMSGCTRHCNFCGQWTIIVETRQRCWPSAAGN